jgi:hypothetical protein
MANAVYALCALTSLSCVFLLVRGFLRNRTSLLFWSIICFLGLAINNIFLFLDLVVYQSVDLSVFRAAIGCFAIGALAFGLVWNTSE